MRLIVVAYLSLILPLVAHAQTVLEKFPLVVHAGDERTVSVGAVVHLADRPFDREQGYGYVRGLLERAHTPTFDGDPSWPFTWRAGVDGYVFRLPAREVHRRACLH